MEYVGDNALTGAALGGATGLVLGGTVGYIAGKRSSAKSSRKRKRVSSKSGQKRSSASRKKGRKLKFGSPAYRRRYLSSSKRNQRKPYTAGKRRDTSRKRIRFTKNNQPYVILSNGRARFISKKSLKSSRKRKGGRY